MSFATSADGVRLYYKTHGRGEPLLLMAGQACDHRDWDRVAEDLMGHFEVIVWDYRGTGQSDKPQEPPYSTRNFAADAVAVLDACGHARAHVYGFSMGGRVAQWFAINYGSRLGSLVLGATSPGNRHGVARNPDVDKALRSGDIDELLLTSFTQQWISANRELADEIASLWNRPLPAQLRHMHYQASQAHDTWDFLPSIQTPTLLIHGSDDEINPCANSELIARRIPGAYLYVLKGARHCYFEEFRAVASQMVCDFLLAHSIARS